ncbi:MAG: hypothetical protein M1816_003921 [Peltula sp. TS41687]|nr:MAG: hypothetical protein M1816_003921 [Peltula sp. TS41687]
MDKEEYILSVELYVPMHWENPATRYGDRDPKGEHGRLLKLYEHPDIPLLVRREALVEAGDTIVAVCGAPKFSTRVRNVVVSELQRGFRFTELTFRPDAAIMEDL